MLILLKKSTFLMYQSFWGFGFTNYWFNYCYNLCYNLWSKTWHKVFKKHLYTSLNMTRTRFLWLLITISLCPIVYYNEKPLSRLVIIGFNVSFREIVTAQSSTWNEKADGVKLNSSVISIGFLYQNIWDTLLNRFMSFFWVTITSILKHWQR